MADAVVDVQAVVAASQDAKAEVRALLDRLPDGLTLEQIQYHLDVYVTITRREERAEKVGWQPHAEFERRFAKWLDK